MKLRFSLILTGIFLFHSVFAKKVEFEKAKNIAKNFYYERIQQFNPVNYDKIFLYKADISLEKKNATYYIFNVGENDGFVIVSADDVVTPVLGYSFRGSIDLNNKPSSFDFVLKNYQKQINNAIKSGIEATNSIKEMWTKLDYSNPLKSSNERYNSVAPLLLTHWKQGFPYNENCPDDIDGSGGHALVGCVAVCLGQVIKYYNYPETGESSNTYYASGYGYQNVNFGNTTYLWTHMPNVANGTNNELAEFLYHCGVSVDMSYGAEGSSSYTNKTVSALKDNFKYSNAVSLKKKVDFSDQEWIELLKNELDNNRPMIYSGREGQGMVGHAFNCDGYQGDDFFHMNWGWGGSADGYFRINSLNPSGYSFNYDQSAVINIYPESGYPEHCTSFKLIDGNEGSFNDGSGVEDYFNIVDCQWLIAPYCGSEIELSFDEFDVAEGDTLIIYDGESTSDDIIAKYSGNYIPENVNSTNNKMLLHFVSGSNFMSKGWSVSYKSISCQGTKKYYESSGTVSDGSNSCDYQKAAICNWEIEPLYAQTINIHFTEFDLAEDIDNLRIYKDYLSDANLIERFDYENLPTDLSINSGKVIIRFFSDTDNSSGGWSFDYSSDVSSVQENDFLDAFRVFPNPVSDKINIENLSGEKILSVELINVFGQTVLQDFSENYSKASLFVLDVNNISDGVYFLKITSQKSILNTKIIIE